VRAHRYFHLTVSGCLIKRESLTICLIWSFGCTRRLSCRTVIPKSTEWRFTLAQERLAIRLPTQLRFSLTNQSQECFQYTAARRCTRRKSTRTKSKWTLP